MVGLALGLDDGDCVGLAEGFAEGDSLGDNDGLAPKSGVGGAAAAFASSDTRATAIAGLTASSCARLARSSLATWVCPYMAAVYSGVLAR